jgi:hypothetical protein
MCWHNGGKATKDAKLPFAAFGKITAHKIKKTELRVTCASARKPENQCTTVEFRRNTPTKPMEYSTQTL